MLPTALRFFALFTTALLMSFTFAHLWQLPPRMEYDGTFWFQTLSMYREFGPGGPGPIVEVASLVSVFALALLEPRGPVRRGASLACLLLLASFAAWWLGVRPVNVEMLAWKTFGVPADWQSYRLRWEYTHAARALAIGAAFAALAVSLLVDGERGARRRPLHLAD